MFRPFYATAGKDDRLNTGELDPALVAASFGVAYEPDKPLPQADVPSIHVEDEPASKVLLDNRKLPKPKDAPPTLFDIAVARLRSLKPRTADMRQQVAAAIADCGVLAAIDELVAALEREHFAAIEARHEELRKQGRALLETLPAIQGELNQAMMSVNQSATLKGRAVSGVREAHEECRTISKWASRKEIIAATEKLSSAKERMNEASEAALADMRAMAAVESKLATAKANLEILETEMDRLEASASGKDFHDPTTGLSVDPVLYRDSW